MDREAIAEGAECSDPHLGTERIRITCSQCYRGGASTSLFALSHCARLPWRLLIGYYALDVSWPVTLLGSDRDLAGACGLLWRVTYARLTLKFSRRLPTTVHLVHLDSSPNGGITLFCRLGGGPDWLTSFMVFIPERCSTLQFTTRKLL